MPLKIHDMTGTQTDCPKPLSRTKLKQLMPWNRNLGRGDVQKATGHAGGPKRVPWWRKKRKQRQDKRRLHAERSLPDGTTFQLLPNAADLEIMKPTLFERLGGLFGNLKLRYERSKKLGR